MLSNGCEGDQVSPLMVGETWSHVSHNWVSCLSYMGDVCVCDLIIINIVDERLTMM
jgi:hypothetical protein